MAKLTLSTTILELLLFRFSDNPIDITGVGLGDDPSDLSIQLNIEGYDIPRDAKHVKAVFTEQTNRAGEKFHTLKFEKIS